MEIHDIRVKGKFTVDPGRFWTLQGPNTTEFAQKKTDCTEFGFIVSLWVAPPRPSPRPLPASALRPSPSQLSKLWKSSFSFTSQSIMRL